MHFCDRIKGIIWKRRWWCKRI